MVGTTKFLPAAIAFLVARPCHSANTAHRLNLEGISSIDGRESSSSHTFESVSSKVNALSSRLAEDELYRKQRLAAKEGILEKKLEQSRLQNREAAEANARVAKNLQELTRDVSELRRRAVGLQKDVTEMQQDLKIVQANLTTVLEFTSGSIAASEEERPELAILSDLAKQEAVSSTEMDHRRRISEVANARRMEELMPAESLAFLQVQSVPNPKHLLSALDSGLTELAEEYEKREIELKSKYTELMRREKTRYAALLGERETLTKETERVKTLQAQLQKAVHVLEERLARLQEQSRSVRMYTQRLGNRAMPFQQTQKELDLEEGEKNLWGTHQAVAEPAAPKDQDEQEAAAFLQEDVMAAPELPKAPPRTISPAEPSPQQAEDKEHVQEGAEEEAEQVDEPQEAKEPKEAEELQTSPASQQLSRKAAGKLNHTPRWLAWLQR